MAFRRKAGILAFQALYCWEASKVPVEELVKFAWVEEEKLAALDEDITSFSKIITAGTVENIEEIDYLINKQVENWDIKRLNRVDLAILRISTFILLYQKEIPSSIVISEAIGISTEFGTDDSYKFINGVLDKMPETILSREEKKWFG